MNIDFVCPECKKTCSEEFIRCPQCQSYLHEYAPWDAEEIFLPLLGALLVWLLLTLVFDVIGWRQFLLAAIFNDHISRFIFASCTYGLIVLYQKYRILGKQLIAFEVIRNFYLQQQENGVNEEKIQIIRGLLKQKINVPLNMLLAYNRLKWIPLLRQGKENEKLTTLRAFEKLLEDDVDAVESGFASIRFLIWLLPSLGFFGTVWGMTMALQEFSAAVNNVRSDLSFFGSLSETIRGLGIAFHTTLVGLGLVIPLLFLSSVLRQKIYQFFNRFNRFFLRLALDVVQSSLANSISNKSISLPNGKESYLLSNQGETVKNVEFSDPKEACPASREESVPMSVNIGLNNEGKKDSQ